MAIQIKTKPKGDEVSIPPLTREFDRELRRGDHRELRAAKASSEAHLADLRREGKPLQSLQFVERY